MLVVELGVSVLRRLVFTFGDFGEGVYRWLHAEQEVTGCVGGDFVREREGATAAVFGLSRLELHPDEKALGVEIVLFDQFLKIGQEGLEAVEVGLKSGGVNLAHGFWYT